MVFLGVQSIESMQLSQLRLSLLTKTELTILPQQLRAEVIVGLDHTLNKGMTLQV